MSPRALEGGKVSPGLWHAKPICSLASSPASLAACAGWQDHLLSSLSNHPVATPSPFMHIMRWWPAALPLLTLTLLATLVVLPALHLQPVPPSPPLPMQPELARAPGLCGSISMPCTPACGSGGNARMAACSLRPHALEAGVAADQLAHWASGTLRRWSDAGQQALQGEGLAATHRGGPQDGGAVARDAAADVKPDGDVPGPKVGEHGFARGSMGVYEDADRVASEQSALLRQKSCSGDWGGGGEGVGHDVRVHADSEARPRAQMNRGNGTARVEMEQRLLELLALVRSQRLDAPGAGDGDVADGCRSSRSSGGGAAEG